MKSEVLQIVIAVIKKAILSGGGGVFAVLFLSVCPSLPTLLPLLNVSVSVRHGDTARHSGVRGDSSPWVKRQTTIKCYMTLRKHIYPFTLCSQTSDCLVSRKMLYFY